MREKILRLKQKTNASIKDIRWVVETFPNADEEQLFDILYTHCLVNYGNKQKTLKTFKKLLTNVFFMV